MEKGKEKRKKTFQTWHTQKYEEAESILSHSSDLSWWRVHWASALLLFSSSITVYCTCYSHSSVREFPSPPAEYRSSLLPVKRRFARSFTVGTVLYRTLANSAPLYWTPPNAPVKNVQFFSPTNLKQFNSGTLHTWTYMKFLFFVYRNFLYT